MILGIRTNALLAVDKFNQWHLKRRFSPLTLGRPLSVVVIGTGGVAPSHLEALQAIGNVTIVGLANRGGTDPGIMARRFGIENHATDYRHLLDALRPDAVFVLVSHGQSKQVVLECLSRGIPCLCEKPAGQNLDEAHELAEAEETFATLGSVGLNRRFYSTINTALAKIRERGPILGISVEFAQPIRGLRKNSRFSSEELDRWHLFNGIHVIDLFRHCCGEVETVHGICNRLEETNGDNFAAALAFKSGAIGSYRSHWVSGLGRHMSAKIYGNGVHADLPNLESCLLKTESSRMPVPLKPALEDKIFKPGVYHQAYAFLDAVARRAEKPPLPLGSFRDSLSTMILVEKLAFSAPFSPIPA